MRKQNVVIISLEHTFIILFCKGKYKREAVLTTCTIFITIAWFLVYLPAQSAALCTYVAHNKEDNIVETQRPSCVCVSLVRSIKLRGHLKLFVNAILGKFYYER